MHYGHNFGVLLHELGLVAGSPWSLPEVDYAPAWFDAPSAAPLYDPFPGGARRFDLDPAVFPPESLPAPTAGLLDGLHPNDTGWGVIVQNLHDQGLGNLLAGQTWD